MARKSYASAKLHLSRCASSPLLCVFVIGIGHYTTQMLVDNMQVVATIEHIDHMLPVEVFITTHG